MSPTMQLAHSRLKLSTTSSMVKSLSRPSAGSWLALQLSKGSRTYGNSAQITRCFRVQFILASSTFWAQHTSVIYKWTRSNKITRSCTLELSYRHNKLWILLSSQKMSIRVWFWRDFFTTLAMELCHTYLIDKSWSKFCPTPRSHNQLSLIWKMGYDPRAFKRL